MRSSENNMTSEESYFEVVSDGAQSGQKHQEPRKKVEVGPFSALRFMVPADPVAQKLNPFQRKKQNQEEIKTPDSPVSVSVWNPKENQEQRVKSKLNAAKDGAAVEDGDKKEYKYSYNDGEFQIDMQLLALETKVRNLREWKAMLKKHAQERGEIGNKKETNGFTIGESVYFLFLVVVLVVVVVVKVFSNMKVDAKQNPIIQKIVEKSTLSIQENLPAHFNLKDKNAAKEKLTESIYLYSQKNYKGSINVVLSRFLNENSCYNLDNKMNDFASSIDTQGECVYVFEEADCGGKKNKFGPETPYLHDLTFWGLDKAISSIQACYQRHKEAQ